MKTTATATTIASLILSASQALGNPLVYRAQMCNVAPTATAAAPQVLSSPTAATAAACQQQCDANTSCKSFAFGLAPGGTAPTCRLFSVAAAQVPSQGTDIMIFDKSCANVPTAAPTPSATTGSGSGTSQGGQTQNQGQTQGQNQGKN